MDDKSDRKELERRLEQAKRMAAFAGDTVTDERLQKLVHAPSANHLYVGVCKPWNQPAVSSDFIGSLSSTTS